MQPDNVSGRCVSPVSRQRGWIKPVLASMLAVAAMVVGVLTYQQTQPDFETLSGESYRWEELKGQWLVVNYFAEWCAPCLREMPELNALAADMPENSRVFTLNYDLKGREALRKMASDYNIEVAMIVAEKNTPLPVPRPSYLPATYIVGPDGDIRKTMMGEVTEAGIRDALGKLQSQSL